MGEDTARSADPFRGHEPCLPEGVTAAHWAFERVRHQNPRIRAFLGCLRMFDGLAESDYAIMHCSPERLEALWHEVQRFVAVIREKLVPALRAPSRIPALEEARRSSEAALLGLDATVLSELDRPFDGSPLMVAEERELLCVSLGQIRACLQNTFGKIIAADPRSEHDADYYLSKRFADDVDDARWLYRSVAELNEYLRSLEEIRPVLLTGLPERIVENGVIPPHEIWSELCGLLLELLNELTAKLKQTLSLRGIRYREMQLLNEYAIEIPTHCFRMLDLHDLGLRMLGRLQSLPSDGEESPEAAIECCHEVFSNGLAHLTSELDRSLESLIRFVAKWLRNIENRRALRFSQGATESTPATLSTE